MTADAMERVVPAFGEKLRLVVFTAGPLLPINRVFFERLALDPLLELAAIIVDESPQPRKPLPVQVIRAIREDGAPWIAFKLRSTLRQIREKATRGLMEYAHGRPQADESYEMFEARTGVPIFRVEDIHSAESLALIRALSPELGVIVGDRILRDSVITIPIYGTLNIHKRTEVGPIGYWEILNGEPSIGVRIAFKATGVDGAPVLAEATVPIEACDTLDSLQFKVDLRGAQLYHEALRRFAQGQRRGERRGRSPGMTDRAPSEYKVWRLRRRLEQKAAASQPALRARVSLMVRLRVFAEYVALLPRLIATRRRLVQARRAPIVILFYHLVTDQPLNHMGLPFTEFVRQLDFLRRHYSVVSLDEAVTRVRSGKNDQVAASITFDDGYRDNTWAVEYLRYFGIPAAFFVSIGHIRDGSAFEHDRQKGFEDARPMSESDLRRLAEDGFAIGSHGVHHEDFGTLAPETADRLLSQSRDLICDVIGQVPVHFSFPKGQRGTNITAASYGLALKHFPYVFSAYGGYCFPQVGCRHFLRNGNPTNVHDLGMVMSGYTGFRECLSGNAWGLKTQALDPCSAAPRAVSRFPLGAFGVWP